VARRARLVIHRTRSKNEILAVLHRNLKPRPPMSDPFGVAGRQWLARQALPVDEQDEDHLPGAISLPLRRIEGEAGTVLDRNQPVIVYCSDVS